MKDLQQYINSQLQGSSIIDTAISQIFNTSPIDMKIQEIEYLLDREHCMSFACIFDPRSMNFNFRVEFGEERYTGAIPDAVMRSEPAPIIVNSIIDMVWDAKVRAFNQIDPEWIVDNENKQAFLDAAMDYGFV